MFTTVIVNKVSFNTRVKITSIQAKIKKKVIGHQVHQQISVYCMPKKATKIILIDQKINIQPG